jgi:hypothetical protein
MRLTNLFNGLAILKISYPNQLTRRTPDAEVLSPFSGISLNLALGLCCSQAEYSSVSPALLQIDGR